MAFHGKVALVTGAGSGMGQISAWRLADEGARVAALDLNAEGLAKTAAGRDNVRSYVCDVADFGAVESTVARITEELGPIDRVTHAAAIMPASPLVDMPAEKILRLMEINYAGTVHLTMATLPAMLERRSGDLILFGSLAGPVAPPPWPGRGPPVRCMFAPVFRPGTVPATRRRKAQRLRGRSEKPRPR